VRTGWLRAVRLAHARVHRAADRALGHRLGSHVTLTRLDGAMHDLYLSGREARERAYDVTLRWLNEVLPRSSDR
jgi:alpha-beta hydrolase superfamily lysophospholipase